MIHLFVNAFPLDNRLRRLTQLVDIGLILHEKWLAHLLLGVLTGFFSISFVKTKRVGGFRAVLAIPGVSIINVGVVRKRPLIWDSHGLILISHGLFHIVNRDSVFTELVAPVRSHKCLWAVIYVTSLLRSGLTEEWTLGLLILIHTFLFFIHGLRQRSAKKILLLEGGVHAYVGGRAIKEFFGLEVSTHGDTSTHGPHVWAVIHSFTLGFQSIGQSLVALLTVARVKINLRLFLSLIVVIFFGFLAESVVFTFRRWILISKIKIILLPVLWIHTIGIQRSKLSPPVGTLLSRTLKGPIFCIFIFNFDYVVKVVNALEVFIVHWFLFHVAHVYGFHIESRNRGIMKHKIIVLLRWCIFRGCRNMLLNFIFQIRSHFTCAIILSVYTIVFLSFRRINKALGCIRRYKELKSICRTNASQLRQRFLSLPILSAKLRFRATSLSFGRSNICGIMLWGLPQYPRLIEMLAFLTGWLLIRIRNGDGRPLTIK